MSDSRLASSSDSFHRSGVGGGARRLWRGLGAGLLSVPLLVIFQTVAQAQVECSSPNPDGSYTVPEDWQLIPAGLSPGSRFRLLFFTNGERRRPDSADIAVYNTFVQNRAKAGHAAISDSCANLFKVVGSTATVNARVNTDMETSDMDAAIYWLKGVKIADDYADFYDGSWDNTDSNGKPYKDEYGRTDRDEHTIEAEIATGSLDNGTRHSRYYLGASPWVVTTELNRPNPLDRGGSRSDIPRRYYGLSPVFTAAQHVITVTADGERVTEGESASFTLRAEPAPSRSIDVMLEVTDSGDFARQGRTGMKRVTLGKGTGSLQFTVATQNDGRSEAHGSITAALRPGSYIVGAESEAVVRVSDDDITAGVTPSVTDVRALPEGGRMSFNIELSKTLDGDQTLTLPLSRGGTASWFPSFSQRIVQDYRLGCEASPLMTCSNLNNVNPSITFHGAELNKQEISGSSTRKLRSVTEVLWLEAIVDNTAESDETVTLSLGDRLKATITLKDPPSSVTLSFIQSLYSVSEDQVFQIFQPTLRVNTEPGQDIVVPLIFTDITATEGEDYEAVATVTFSADGSLRQSFDIPLLDDMVYEGNETFRVEIDASRLPDGVKVGSRSSATFEILENEPRVVTPPPPPQRPMVTVSAGASPVTEGTAASFTVSRTGSTASALTVLLSVAENTAGGQDFVAAGNEGNKSVTIASGSATATYSVATVGDSTDEPDGRVTVSLRNSGDYNQGSPSSASVVVNDDDTAPDTTAPRVSSIQRFIPLASPTNSNSLTWRVEFSEDVRNVDVSDFRLSGTTATLSIPRTGNPSLSFYRVVASGGDLADLNGTVVLGFASGHNIRDNNGNRLVNTRPTGANEDHFVVSNTAALTVVVTGGSAITEGGDAVFTLTANPAPPSPLPVNVSVTQTGDVAAIDNSFRTVVIPASGSTTYTVATVDDTMVEVNGRVTVEVTSGDYTVGNPSSASMTVHDNDGTSPPPTTPPPATPATSTTPTITIRGSNPNPVTEGSGANFTLTATPPPLSPLEVTVTVTQTGNFVASDNLNFQTVTIPPSGSMTHTVATVDDTMPEANGMVRVTVSQGTGYTVGSLASAAVTVHDNDGTSPPPTVPTVTIIGGPSPITEGTAAAFTVSRSGPVTAPLTMLLRVREITTDGQDFVATAQEGGKRVTIPSGAATALYTVPTVNDNTDEPNGMVTVALNRSSVYLVGSPSAASVNVNDDDVNAVTPVVSIMGGGVITEGQPATFTVTAVPAPPPGESISVNVAISDSGNFAATGQSGSRSVTIDATGMARITVSTQDDAVHEEHGRITATVAGGSGYTPHAGNGSAAVTVEDDDPALMLSVSSLRVAEGGSASYTIALDTRPTGDVTVAISGDAATDLTLTPTSLTFTPSNWNRPQRVTLAAPEDTNLIGAALTLTHTASGANYGGIIATVTVAVVAASPTEEAKAWQLRLGRTVSHQVVDALQDRLSAPPATGLQLIVAGEAITSAPPLAEHEGLLSKALGFDPLTAQALVEDSSFSLAPEQEGGAPRLAFWGQGAFSSFRGEEEEFSLDGTVTTLLLGADWSGQRWQGGAALSQSWGSGSYESDTDVEGEVSSTVTGLFPYGRYALTPRLGLWAIAGYGWGQLSLNPDGPADDATPSTTMAMAALGIDGLLLDGGSEGITLSSTADVLTLKTTSAEVDGLDSSEGSFSRLRLGIEASRPFPLSNGASLLPSLELGIRQDSGDAESGFGVDLGAGILWQAPQRGISGALKGRTLLTHAEEEFQEQGLAVSFSWAPNPSNRGPSLSLSHAMGATAAGGMDALLHPTTFEGLDADPSSGKRFEAELAYGFPAHKDRLTLTPAVALALSPTSRNTSLLWSLAPYAEPLQGEPWQLSLAAERQEPNASPSPVEHSLKLTFSTLF